MKLKLIYLIIILILLTSCLGTKKVFENNTSKKSTEKTEIKKDSSNVVEKNKSISDKLDLSVPKTKTDDLEFNKRVDSKVDEILAKLNTSKKSGDNSYKLYYNLLKRQIEFEAKIGETKNETKETNSSEVSEKSFEEKTDEYISKKVSSIPWWIYVLLLFWFSPQIIQRVQSIINPISGMIKKTPHR
jgi:uncharacterized protein YycO